MAENVYVDIIPSYIPNTVMQKRVRDGMDYTYRITAAAGFVLHDKARDWDRTDEDGNVLGINQGFTRATASCFIGYDFTPITVHHTNADGNIVPVTAYGAQREFYAVPESDAPADNIFGGGNDREAM